MRNTIIMVVAIATAVLTSCTKTDKENLVGTWGIQKVTIKGDIVASIDEKDHAKIVDKVWKEQGQFYEQMGMTKQDFMKKMTEESKNLAKITFVYSENGNVTISPNDGKNKGEKAKYTIDEKKKEISLERKLNGTGKKDVYSYTFEDDQLVMTQKEEQLTLVRKTK